MNDSLQIVIMHQIYKSYLKKNEVTPKSDEKEKAAFLPSMPKTLISGLFTDFESATWIQISCYVRVRMFGISLLKMLTGHDVNGPFFDIVIGRNQSCSQYP